MKLNLKVTTMKESINREANKCIIDALIVLRTIIKHNLSLELFTVMVDMCVETGSPNLAKLRLAKNATYSSWDIVHELIGLLSDAVEEHIVTDIKNSPCYATMVDEVADIDQSSTLQYVAAIFHQKGKLRQLS